jgi:hypothetical protein
MAVTKEDILKELRDVHVQFNEATRKLLAITLKAQNLSERQVIKIDLPPNMTAPEDVIEFVKRAGIEINYQGHPQLPGVAASKAQPTVKPHPNDGVLVDGKTTQPRIHVPSANPTDSFRGGLAGTIPDQVFLPQMNTQEAIDAARQRPSVQEALSAAKDVFRHMAQQAGMPAGVLENIDKVSVEDIEARRTAAAQPRMPQALPAQDDEAQSAQDVLSSFIGRGSIFMEVLHPDVLFGARGEVKPDDVSIKRHGDDAKRIEEVSLRLWPTGFYTDHNSKAMQFLVNTDQMAVLVEALPSESSPVSVFVYGSKSGWRDLLSFQTSEHKLIYAKLDDALQQVKKKLTPPEAFTPPGLFGAGPDGKPSLIQMDEFGQAAAQAKAAQPAVGERNKPLPWLGRDGIFARYLHPEAITHGRGKIRSDIVTPIIGASSHDVFEQISHIGISNVPSGFYVDNAGRPQFFANLGSGGIVCENLWGEEQSVKVEYYGDTIGMRPLSVVPYAIQAELLADLNEGLKMIDAYYE